MPVQRLRAEAQEADQRVLSHLQEAHQGRHQDVSAVMGPHTSRYCVLRAVVFSTSGRVGLGNLSGDEPNSDIMVPIFFFFFSNLFSGGGKKNEKRHPSCCTKTANTSSFILTREIREGL